jgi:hypothetical protein
VKLAEQKYTQASCDNLANETKLTALRFDEVCEKLGGLLNIALNADADFSELKSQMVLVIDKIANVQKLEEEVDKQDAVVALAEQKFTDAQANCGNNENMLNEACGRLDGLLNTTLDANTDFTTLKSKVAWAIKFQSVVEEFSLGENYVASVCDCNSGVFAQSENNLLSLRSWQAKVRHDLERFANLFDDNHKETFYSLSLQLLNERLLGCKDNFASLEYLIDYRNAEKKMVELGVDAYLAKVKGNKFGCKRNYPCV